MYLVVFRNRKRAEIDQARYDAEADRMFEMAQAQPGFRAFRSYTADDGETVAISEWDSEEAARGWGRVAEHRVAQANGRSDYYESYTLFGCDNPRIHDFTAKEPL